VGDHRPRPTLREDEEEDEEDEEEDEVEVVGVEWTLSHYPPLVARWLLSCSWRGSLLETRRRQRQRRSPETTRFIVFLMFMLFSTFFYALLSADDIHCF
jgi:hypothetical protein